MVDVNNMTLKEARESASFDGTKVGKFIQQYGVPGMRWGHRKRRDSGGSREPTPVEVKVTPGKRVQARGGKAQPAHEDAINTAASRQKARQSTTDSLSTVELKKLVERMQLEQNYSKLAAAKPTRLEVGKKFAFGIIKDETMAVARGKHGPVVGFISEMSKAKYKGKHR